MSREDGQSIIGAEGTPQTPAEELEQNILLYLGDKDTPQFKAFSHLAERYDIDAKAAMTGQNQTRKRVENQKKINQGLGDDEYRREWTQLNRKMPDWYNAFTQGITDPYIRQLAFARQLVRMKNLAEANPSQQPPPQSGK